jgi:hypothetical protein
VFSEVHILQSPGLGGRGCSKGKNAIDPVESTHRSELVTESEEPQDIIEDTARRSGLTEKEARILYHLSKATDYYFELLDEEGRKNLIDTMMWTTHEQVLVRELMARVARRDHPEGWRTERRGEDGGHSA